MSRSGDFRGDNGQTDRQTDYFTPRACAGHTHVHTHTHRSTALLKCELGLETIELVILNNANTRMALKFAFF